MDTTELQHEFSLLRILYHRNKNQHRVTTWWKWLNSLKRTLTKVLCLPDRLRLQPLVKKLKLHIIPGCYRAFNNIISLGQFVTLGLVLLGLLARINKCIDGLGVVYETKPVVSKLEIVPTDDDLGQVIETEELDVVAAKVVPIEHRTQRKGRDKEKKNKKKKKRSAIDDIFG
ncbi:unnamed protein product [Cyberlindnera jadinii]|uniref:RNase MRP protein 1 RNA binding domain-containing protein n=1 Tax=Cyberlindnera jadinii (strain ATCC 18201 / CBS 1600 / BCRC 20928 / JCM 3617 / NBRC 0987 / NRRL Y-1542) TaxID=983966 RepID=A0A0H5C777_CYBJN|nr:hypothetical protein CYBJADRAFT_174595 [Cyberlindnera jadinii NRRL Y-1542]ODV71940.1 hypothetical protein CYBJADRAFT_174595 [Cyberlindnera jadinii NRRL Y-1542]CEP23762.1 unnamed protein product [Cyberlindnera jadinii]